MNETDQKGDWNNHSVHVLYMLEMLVGEAKELRGLRQEDREYLIQTIHEAKDDLKEAISKLTKEYDEKVKLLDDRIDTVNTEITVIKTEAKADAKKEANKRAAWISIGIGGALAIISQIVHSLWPSI